MTMTDIVDLEEAFTKSGAELFKELYRVYPVADAEDYYKNGQWKNEVMKTDLMLMESHRRESGAPDVPDLEDIKVPNLPQPNAAMVSAGYGPASFMGQAYGAKPAAAGFTAAPVPVNFGGAAAGTSAPVVEIRLIALFVAKWKLDPVTAKTLLAKLTPTHRRFVIQNFKTTATGIEATTELGKFIAQCEEDKTWDSAAAVTATNGVVPAKPATVSGTAMIAAAKAGILGAGARPVAPRPVGATVGVLGAAGLKRPVTPVVANPAWAQNKRPALISPAGVVRPPVWGAKGAGK